MPAGTTIYRGSSLSIGAVGGPTPNALFEGLSKAMEKKIARRATRAGATVVLNAARSIVGKRTGKLARGLRVRALKRSRKRFGHKVVTPTREYLGIAKDAKHYYPAVLEYGTKGGRPWKSDPRKRTKARAPHPFMRPALKNNQGAVLEAVRSTIKVETERTIKAQDFNAVETT